MSKFKSKLSLSLSLTYVMLSQSLNLSYVTLSENLSLSYTTLNYSLQLPAPVSDKLFTYLLVLAKNRNVTAYLFIFKPKSRPGPTRPYSLEYLPSKPENITKTGMV